MTSTRSSSEVFLVGHPSPNFPPGVLPTNLDILREVLWKKELLGETLPSNKIVSCPLDQGIFGAICSKDEGCLKLEEDKYCTLQKIKKCWNQAGIKTVGDSQIRCNIVKLWTEFKELKKKRTRLSVSAVQDRDQFKIHLTKCFNISSKDALETIQNDKKRDDKAKESDIIFLADQLGDRKMIFTTLDKKYDDVVKRVEKRKQNLLSRKTKEEIRVSATDTVELDEGWEDLEAETQDDLNDATVVSPIKKKSRIIPIGGMRKRARKIKGRTILLDVPVDILQKTATDAARLNLSPSQHQGILAAFINASGGSVDEFPISDSSSRRDRKKALKTKKQEILDNFKASVNSENIKLVGHFDGKLMKELVDNNNVKVDRQKEDRMAVLVTSPDLVDKEQLLGILALEDGTGKSQKEGVMELMTEWGAWDNLIGLVFDTTSSNTGIWKGAVTLLEKEKGFPILKMPCRRHVYELHAKHVAYQISGRETTGPGDKLFLEFRANWDEIKPEIDYTKLVKFDWKQCLGSPIETQAHNVLLWCKKALVDKTFPRSDYQEMVELIVVFLGGVVEGFQFRKLRKVSSARFLQKGLMYISMRLLHGQYNLFTRKEDKEIKVLAEFSAIYYGVWFLITPLTASAPRNDLQAIHQMRVLMPFRKQEATACLESWERHLDYLSPPLVVFCLADDDLSNDEKRNVADALLSLLTEHDIEGFKPDGRVKVPGPNFTQSKDYWAIDQDIPSLSQFVDVTSWLIFIHLGMLDIDQMMWLTMEVEDWENQQDFIGFKDFVKNLTCVNDPAERSIKLAQDFIDDEQNEEDLQAKYVVVSEHRKMVKGTKKGRKLKGELKRMGGL